MENRGEENIQKTTLSLAIRLPSDTSRFIFRKDEKGFYEGKNWKESKRIGILWTIGKGIIKS